MNPYTVLLYISCCLLFMLRLFGWVSPYRARRERFALGWGITFGIFVVFFLIMSLISDSTILNVVFLLSFGYGFPGLMAALLNKEWAGAAILKTKRGPFELIQNIAAILYFSPFLLASIGWFDNPRTSVQQSQSIQQAALLMLPLIGMWAVVAIQKIEFGTRGILYYGFLYAYSDIKAYSWYPTKKTEEIDLVLRLRPGFIKRRAQLDVSLPIQDKPAVERILAQYLPDQPAP